MNYQTFVSLIDLFPQTKALCLGDIMLDQFIYGSVDRISPEAPVPIFHIKRRIEMLGGAGNVVRNLSSLHGNVHFIGVVGNDLVGKKISEQLQNIDRISFDLVQDEHRCSTQKVRYVSGSHQLLRGNRRTIFLITHSQLSCQMLCICCTASIAKKQYFSALLK